jgi:hypothetical protein
MQEGEEWCAHHGRHRREHLVHGKCTTVLSSGVWCRNKPSHWGEHQCDVCIEKVKQEAAESVRLQKERQQAAEIQAAAQRKQEQEEEAALRAQPWFPALGRMLEERETEMRRNIKE